ncbi:MAG TPA: SDR family oxidoreductase [Smithellaceae bacterium]|jgi:3-oxoacyl-[acyl-carrier protein] reductase|nr:SDR family oxidoreductase [Smithellaceae bacterium]
MSNLTALVTGASRGIGAAIAKKMVLEGLTVIAPSRADLDLRSGSSIESFLGALTRPIDILVNNAGVNMLSSISEASDSVIQETLQVNLVAPLQLIRCVANQMMARRFGRIVNISSIWSIVSKKRRLTYSASKAGLNGMTRALAVELAPYNILINAVAPGYVNTELTRQNNSEQDIHAIKETIPLRRLAEPSEIAETVFFLCSERNTYITGQVITVDGGFTCQ